MYQIAVKYSKWPKQHLIYEALQNIHTQCAIFGTKNIPSGNPGTQVNTTTLQFIQTRYSTTRLPSIVRHLWVKLLQRHFT
jgi:hypothetical protein